ncbi:MAG: hypothetical protein MUC88_07080 [Planctomycetes bacterium]|nr:hypothetical protein [Planctomycetota bacterium]
MLVRHSMSSHVLLWFLPVLLSAETLTLPRAQRPEWLRRDGIVMAGSWEPLLFRVRRDGAEGYTPTDRQLADYLHEHSPEMVAQLKALGVNFVMMHCYKGGGLQAERRSMEDAVRFARLCHEAGLHVGVYNFSGAFIWELFFQEKPEAKDWVALDDRQQPIPYGSGAAYRYYWNRNHPAAEAFYQGLVRFAVEDIKADLIHFDNYSVGPGCETVSIERFRRYLTQTFSASELTEAGIDAATAQPPALPAGRPRAEGGTPSTPGTPALLERVWLDFTCASLAESYHRMNRFARGLRRDVLVELNPGGVPRTIRPPVDHGRLLAGGEAYWDESARPSYRNGRLVSRIRTYKVGRALENMVFSYITTPLEAAESLAFNLDCLGAICWFEYGRIVERPGAKASMSEQLGPYVRFYRERRDLFRDTTVVADAAVLRSFPAQVFDPNSAALTARVEDALTLGRQCFQIVHDHQLGDLDRYPVLVLAGCAALSDTQLEQIRRYVDTGGRLCIVGPVATHDQWLRPRAKPGLGDLPPDRVVRVPAQGDGVEALGKACPGGPSLAVSTAPDSLGGLCCELTEQAGRRLVHLVNYRDSDPVEKVAVRVRLPAGRKATSVTLVGPGQEDRVLEYTTEEGTVTFTVPRIEVYEIAAVTWAAET